jgi:hypothetical protein
MLAMYYMQVKMSTIRYVVLAPDGSDSKGNPPSTPSLQNPFFTPKKGVVCTGITVQTDHWGQVTVLKGLAG